MWEDGVVWACVPRLFEYGKLNNAAYSFDVMILFENWTNTLVELQKQAIPRLLRKGSQDLDRKEGRLEVQ